MPSLPSEAFGKTDCAVCLAREGSYGEIRACWETRAEKALSGVEGARHTEAKMGNRLAVGAAKCVDYKCLLANLPVV